jgi:integrase
MSFLYTGKISGKGPIAVGVSPKVVSEQLGHTSAAFTLDVYSHVLPHMQDDAAAKVEAALIGS